MSTDKPEPEERQEPTEAAAGQRDVKSPGSGPEDGKAEAPTAEDKAGGVARNAIGVGALVLALVVFWYVAYYRHTASYLGKQIVGKDIDARIKAAAKLGEMGPKAAPAMKHLIAALEDPSPAVYAQASQALGSLGDEDKARAVPGLIKTIESGGDNAKLHSARLLGPMGNIALDAVPALVAAAKSPSAAVRVAAIGAIKDINADVPEVASLLFAALDDMDAQVREQAKLALARLGGINKEVVPRLIQRIDKMDVPGGLAALEAIALFGADAASGLDPVMKHLVHKHPSVRGAALQAATRVAPEEPKVHAALVAALKDDQAIVRSRSLDLLAEVWRGSEKAKAAVEQPDMVAPVLAGLNDKNRDVRARAIILAVGMRKGNPEIEAKVAKAMDGLPADARKQLQQAIDLDAKMP